MSRRIPDCAWCGKTLRKGPSVRLRFGALPGAPEVGWHAGDENPWDCWLLDPLARLLIRDRDGKRKLGLDEIEGHLRQIHTAGEPQPGERAPGYCGFPTFRLSARRAWFEHLRATRKTADEILARRSAP